MPGPAPIDPAIRYHAKVDKRGPNDCWLWTAACFDKGYGAFRLGQKQVKAHRFGYELLVGPIPNGLYVLHRCDTPPCQNPAHWFLGTHKDNADDRQTKGRGNQLTGEHCPWSKLTETDVLTIRQLYHDGTEQPVLAKQYSVNQTMISQIIRGKRWRQVGGPLATANRTVKLTENDVRLIRTLVRSGLSQQALADMFSVRQTTISEIVLRKTWQNVP